MKLSSFFILLTSSFLIGSCSTAQQGHSIMFYNVENLFDTIDDPETNDNEFLPSADRQWNEERYQLKISRINEVINSFETPLIMGVCEVENRQVVQDIVSNGKLKSTHGIVHYESLDQRGIDVALIYDSIHLELNNSGYLRYEMPGNSSPSRDIVWASLVNKSDTIIAMVNHWPSRRGGAEESEPKRMIAANAARKFIDSIQQYHPAVKIVFMGDLNDYPTNNAPKLISEVLEPMISKSSGRYGGTYNYRGDWDVLDHIMVSSNFFKKKSTHVKKNSGTIFSESYILDVYKGDTVPFRTYGGRKYLKGYSDHLPVGVSIILK